MSAALDDFAPTPADVGLSDDEAFEDLRAKAAPYFDLQIGTIDGVPMLVIDDRNGRQYQTRDAARVEEIIRCLAAEAAEVTVARRGRGKSQKSLDLVAAARTILEELRPTTVRSVCYQLFIRYPGRFIRSMSNKNDTNGVSRQLVWAREQGIVPWEWIVDETRRPETVNQWDDPATLIEATVSQYRKNYWQAQPNRVEVWSEKGTIRGTLAPVLDKYGVTFQVIHGHCGATTVRDVAVFSRRDDGDDDYKPLTILYCGDYDPSGMHMSEADLPNRIAQYGGAAVVRRIAIAGSDLAGLPTFPASDKKNDPRYKWFVENYGPNCCEVDALSPVVLRRRVEAEIGALLDIDAWEHAIRIEAAERASMSELLGTWQSICGQASKYSPQAPA